MDFPLVGRLVKDKLRDRTTYILAAVVGTLINVYGQLLVPWFRHESDPFDSFMNEFEVRPGLATLSVFLGYAFPFCVGIYSGVAARYKFRRAESMADFPDRKPDPVFRALSTGEIVEVGSSTREFFDSYGIDRAQKIVGEGVWAKILNRELADTGTTIFFEAEAAEYMVTYAPTDDDQFNIYLTRTGQKIR